MYQQPPHHCRPITNTPEHRAASAALLVRFLAAMGPDLTLREVAAQVPMSRDTLRRWSGGDCYLPACHHAAVEAWIAARQAQAGKA